MRRPTALPLDRLDRLPERFGRLPTPVGGLALGLASLGLSWENVAPDHGIAEAAAVVAAILLSMLTYRFIRHPQTLAEDLRNPVVGGVAATYAMGWMIVSITVTGWVPWLGHIVWAAGFATQIAFLSVFATHQARTFELSRMVPSWFVPPVGLIVAAVAYRGPESGPAYAVTLAALAFGMVAYAAMLPVMFYRFIFGEQIPVGAMPTLAILAAPASLSLVGYISLIDDPAPLPIILLVGIAVLMTTIVYVAFIRLLALPFSPGFAAYTFPMAIGATAQFKVSGQFADWGLSPSIVADFHTLAVVELIVATLVIAYVVAGYAEFTWTHWLLAHGPQDLEDDADPGDDD